MNSKPIFKAENAKICMDIVRNVVVMWTTVNKY